jgi:hypothetical protein
MTATEFNFGILTDTETLTQWQNNYPLIQRLHCEQQRCLPSSISESSHRRLSGTPLTKSHVGTLQSIDLKRDQPHHSPQKTSYAVLSSESSSHTGYICVLAVSPAQLFPSLVPHLLQHYTVIPHKGSILHTSMRSSDGHTRRDAFRWKGPNTKRTSVA